jgi:hypothetical protein
MLAMMALHNNLAVQEFLHMVAHSFVVHLPLCAEEDPSSTTLPLLFFLAGTWSPSSNQSSLPLMNSLSLGSGRGKFTLATLKPPLSSPLIYFLASCIQIRERSLVEV